MDQSWRREQPVLVPEAGTLGAIGVIRSLGRAGYPVHACARAPEALGLRSRYASAAVVCPEYDRPEFLGWLRAYVRDHGIRAIVPSEGFALAIRPAFAEFAPLLPVPRDEATYYAGFSKADVQRTLSAAGGEASAHLPPSLCVESSGAPVLAADLEPLGAPLFVKVDGCHSYHGQGGRVVKAESAGEAAEAVATLREQYARVLVQGYVPGRGVGAFFLLWDGEVLAEFGHRRLHEVPPSGGVSSLRESFQHEAMRRDALAKLRALRWQGVGMLEYRLDEQADALRFIEFNGRFWGSLHLALFAGVDFPRLLLDAFHGHPGLSRGYPAGVRCRDTFPQEVRYVACRLRERGLGLSARAWSVLEFGLLSLDPRVHSDLLYPGDRALWLSAAWRSLRDVLIGGFRRRPRSGH